MKLSNLLLSSLSLSTSEAYRKPNVVLLLADDMGMGDISLNNENGKIKTPNIDSIGQMGVNFLDGHAGSTKCSPSRYALMTGRFSFHNVERANIRKLYQGTPHLADLFNRNGYRTGIVGKTAPIEDQFKSVDADFDAEESAKKKLRAWKKTLGGGTGIRGPHEDKASFYVKANYTMPTGAHTAGYDYAFLNQYACCRVGGGYFENGVSVEPFDKFAIQRPYPEGSHGKDSGQCNEYRSYNGEYRCDHKPYANGYVGAPFFDERVEGPVYVPNFPPSILVQPSYDSRTVETRISDKAIEFIRDSIRQDPDKPFFLYYGFRAGHNPFNSEQKYRGKTTAGEIGEAITELDNNVGRVLKTLRNFGIEDDTIVVFMSDNGAISRADAVSATQPYPEGSYMWDTYQHYQNSITLDGNWYKLRAGKNSAYEGGHRMPFLWKYPRMIKPKVDRQSIVSYVDVYKTLAEFIGDQNVPCNEAPDSRSLFNVLTNDDVILREPMMQHSVFQGTRSMRDGPWKIISGTKELFNLDNDMEEFNNLWDSEPEIRDRMMAMLTERVEAINERELRTDEGRKGPNVC